jgi:hypothetical protein
LALAITADAFREILSHAFFINPTAELKNSLREGR